MSRFALDPACALYLPLHLRDGEAFMEKSGRGHRFENQGSAWTPQGRWFNGVNNYIESAEEIAWPNAGGLTILAWVLWGPPGDFEQLFSEDTLANPHVQFYKHNTRAQLWFTYHTGAAAQYPFSSQTFVEGSYDRWSLVGVSVRYEEVAGGYIDFLYNTDRQREAAPAYPMNFPSASRTKFIGRRSTRYFGPGTIGEIGIWLREFTRQEVEQYYLESKERCPWY